MRWMGMRNRIVPTGQQFVSGVMGNESGLRKIEPLISFNLTLISRLCVATSPMVV